MEKMPKNAKFYNCELCNFKCIKKSNYTKHLSTRKHNNHILVNGVLIEKMPQYICSGCKKEYKSNVGLWKHNKKCQTHNNNLIITNHTN